jgi:Fe-S cluster assembly protein SufD
MRAASLAELLVAGFPLRRDEEWIHTPLRAVAEARYRLGSAAPAFAAPGWGSELAHELVAGEPVLLLTCNGAIAGPGVVAAVSADVGISTDAGISTNAGISANAGNGVAGGPRAGGSSGARAAAPAIAGVRRASWDGTPRAAATFTRPLATAFTRLATAFGDHAVLRCDAAAGGVPLHLVHLVEPGALAAPRVTVSIAAGARVTLVESVVAVNGPAGGITPGEAAGDAAHGRSASNGAAAENAALPDHATAAGNALEEANASAASRAEPNVAPGSGGAPFGAASLSCADTEIRLGAGASLTYVRVQAVGAEAFDFGTTTVVQEQDSELHALSVALGGRIARHTCNVLAAAPGTNSRLGGATVAVGGQVLDHHTYLEHAAPGCASRQLYRTVLGRGGHAVFAGRILVRPVAQQTDAFQLNQNLLLDDARVDTKPQLEIGADDVRCTHGATTGRLNEDQLFYLQARAIPRAQGVRMLARGFVDEVVGELPDAALRPRLLKLLHRRLDRLEGSVVR